MPIPKIGSCYWGHQPSLVRGRGKLRVALTTQERKIVKKHKLFGKTEHFIVLEGHDARIHALYFCPQLYKKDDGALVPLSGQEIGQLMAQILEEGAIAKSPWYEPSDMLPKESIITVIPDAQFDTLVVDTASAKAAKAPALRAVERNDKS
jgi:hypothetical protein